MSNSDNHPEISGGAKLAALKAAGQFQELGEYSTLPAFTAYAVEAAYDQLVMNEKEKPASDPVEPKSSGLGETQEVSDQETPELSPADDSEEDAADEEEFQEPLPDGDDE